MKLSYFLFFFLGLFVFIIFRKIKKIIRVRGNEALNRRGKINIKASELIGGIKEIKIKGLNNYALKILIKMYLSPNIMLSL